MNPLNDVVENNSARSELVLREQLAGVNMAVRQPPNSEYLPEMITLVFTSSFPMPIKIPSRSETHLEDHPETNIKLSDFDVVSEEIACLL